MRKLVCTDVLRDTTIGSRSLSYDNNGNLTTLGTTTHTWDYKNRLTRTVGNSATTTYGYDHTGQRVWMATNGTATTTYINKWYDIFATKSGATTTATTTSSFFTGDTLIGSITTTSTNGAATTTPTISYIHTDHLNSTNVVTNASGTPTYTLDYLPYGERRVNTGTDVSQREYIGERYDEGTQLSYLNARYHDGVRGQFLSQDPVFLSIGNLGNLQRLTGKPQQAFLADPQLMNSYSYGRDNPITMKDPEGLDPYSSMQLWFAYNSSPQMAAAKQQLAMQLQAGFQGAIAATKFSGAVVGSGVAVATNPGTLPYVLSGWTNVAASVYQDYQEGTLDRTGNSYALQFGFGAGTELPLIQTGSLLGMIGKSTVVSGFANYAVSGTLSARSLVANAAGTLAGRIGQAAGGYAAGSAMNATLMQLSKAVASLAAQIGTLQATASDKKKDK